MIHIAGDVVNPDGKTVTMTVVYDLNGVSIVRKSHENGELQTTMYTHAEADKIYELLDLAHPAYKKGMETF